MRMSTIATGLHHIHLYTPDLMESTFFYSDLGWELLAPPEGSACENPVSSFALGNIRLTVEEDPSRAEAASSLSLCIAVNDVREAFSFAQSRGFSPVDEELCVLSGPLGPVTGFRLKGPSGEYVWFCQEDGHEDTV